MVEIENDFQVNLLEGYVIDYGGTPDCVLHFVAPWLPNDASHSVDYATNKPKSQSVGTWVQSTINLLSPGQLPLIYGLGDRNRCFR